MIVRIRGACTRAERDAFVTLAAKGDEVNRDAIETGVERAAALLSMQHDGALIAVAAVKRTFDSYRRGVFKDAGVPDVQLIEKRLKSVLARHGLSGR